MGRTAKQWKNYSVLATFGAALVLSTMLASAMQYWMNVNVSS